MKIKIFLIALLTMLIYMSSGQNNNEFEVTNIYATNVTENLIEYTWTLPANSSYDGFSVETYIVDTSTFQSVNISKDQNSFVAGNLEPGTTVTLTISTIKDSNYVAYVSYTYFSLCGDVLNPTIESITEQTVTVIFKPPDGYYNLIYIICSSEDNTISDETNFVGLGVSSLSCYFLPPGSRFTINIITAKKNSFGEVYSNGIILPVQQTVLGKSSLEFKDISGTEVNVTLTTPDGFFDYLELEFKLVSTNSKDFFLNPNISRSECSINYVIKKSPLTSDLIKRPINVTDLCPLSFWNVTVRTVREGFESVEGTGIYRSGYLNVNCTSATLETIGNKTTFYWPNSLMKVNRYYLSVSYLVDPENILIKEIIPYGQNNWTVFGLQNNKEVILSITVENTVKNITSDACLKQLKTGDPCSTYDELYEIDKKTAPYPDAIEIYIPTKIFTSTGYINDIKLLVSTSTGCLTEYQKGCYVSMNINLKDFYKNSTYIAFLPLISKCYNASCNLTFEMDRDYYFTLVANGACGRIYSNELIFEIPSPFPLAAIVGSIVGVAVFIVLVLLTVIVVLAVRHIRKKHQEELTILLSETKPVNNDEILHAWF